MDEVIVWDEDRKCFAKQVITYKIDRDNNVKVVVYLDKINKNQEIRDDKKIYCNNFTICTHIHKKDINDKKIYADCSVVEFKYFKTIDESIKLRGYFHCNRNDLRCGIKLFKTTALKDSSLWFNNARMFDFKIIDTLQENKLGLYDG